MVPTPPPLSNDHPCLTTTPRSLVPGHDQDPRSLVQILQVCQFSSRPKGENFLKSDLVVWQFYEVERVLEDHYEGAVLLCWHPLTWTTITPKHHFLTGAEGPKENFWPFSGHQIFFFLSNDQDPRSLVPGRGFLRPPPGRWFQVGGR